MPGGIHGMRDNFAFWGIADMAGKTELRAFDGMAKIDHAFLAFSSGDILRQSAV